MDQLFGIKELYDIKIKATYPIEFNGRKILEGETIAFFDSIQISNFSEIVSTTKATGGFDNRSLIYWENVKEVNFNFAQGIFSKEQFALMANANLLQNEGKKIIISRRENLESDENGIITLSYIPINNIFIYNKETSQKIDFITVDQNKLKINLPYTDVIIDYEFEYNNNSNTMQIGKILTSGYVSLEGKTRVKDDITGHTHTGIIKIPKLKLLSNISITLGRNAQPLVSMLKAVGVPTGDRSNKKIMEIIFLDDDIDSDI